MRNLEEDGEGVDLDRPVEGEDGTEAELVPAGGGGEGGAEDGEPAERAAGGAGLEDGLEHHDENADEGEEDLGKEGEDVGGHC